MSPHDADSELLDSFSLVAVDASSPDTADIEPVHLGRSHHFEAARMFVLFMAVGFLSMSVLSVGSRFFPHSNPSIDVPVPFSVDGGTFQGALVDLGTKGGRAVKLLTFDAGEISESIPENSLTMAVTPDSPTILDGASLALSLTAGKKIYGYQYTSQDAAAEKAAAARAAAGNPVAFAELFPGSFFVSDAEADDPFIASFAAQKNIVFRPLTEVFLRKNSRYLFIPKDVAIRFTVRASETCGNGTTEGSEQCDDGNTDSGDGCSATCQTETPSVAACIDHQDNDTDGGIDVPGSLADIDAANPTTSQPTSFYLQQQYGDEEFIARYREFAIGLEYTTIGGNALRLAILDTTGVKPAVRLPLDPYSKGVMNSSLASYALVDDERGMLYFALVMRGANTTFHHLYRVSLLGTPSIAAQYDYEASEGVDTYNMIQGLELTSDGSMLHLFRRVPLGLGGTVTSTTLATDSMTVVAQTDLSLLGTLLDVERVTDDVFLLFTPTGVHEFDAVQGQVLRTFTPDPSLGTLASISFDAVSDRAFLVTSKQISLDNNAFTAIIFDTNHFAMVTSAPIVGPGLYYKGVHYDRMYLKSIALFDASLDRAYVSAVYANSSQTSTPFTIEMAGQGSSFTALRSGEDLLPAIVQRSDHPWQPQGAVNAVYDRERHTLYAIDTSGAFALQSQNMMTGERKSVSITSLLPSYDPAPVGSLTVPRILAIAGHSLVFSPQWRRNVIATPESPQAYSDFFIGSPVKVNLGDAGCTGPDDSTESE